jgi:amidase
VIGPLHGVPIIIKDNIATFDKMNTTAGSFSLLGAKVTQDSTMAAKLREAGVIIVGKANLSQWANYRSSNSTNGWTSRGPLALVLPWQLSVRRHLDLLSVHPPEIVWPV